MLIESRVQVFRSCRCEREDEDRRNRGEGTVHGPKAKQLIANRHECMYSGIARRRRPRPRASLCGVSHDRERAMTPVGVLGREKKARPMDILMPLCVCVFGMSRFIADSNRSRADRCSGDGVAPRRYGNAVSGRVTALLGDDSNRGA